MELGPLLARVRRLQPLVALLEQSDVYPDLDGTVALIADAGPHALATTLDGYLTNARELHRAAVVLAALACPGSDERLAAATPQAWVDSRPLTRALRRALATTPAAAPGGPAATSHQRRGGRLVSG